MAGAETAHHLALQFKKVTLVEMRRGIALDADSNTRRQIAGFLEKRNVNILTNTKVLKITESGVIVEGREEMEIPADSVVLAVGVVPDNKLAGELAEAGFEVRVIGDAAKAATVMEAVEQGFDIGRSI